MSDLSHTCERCGAIDVKLILRFGQLRPWCFDDEACIARRAAKPVDRTSNAEAPDNALQPIQTALIKADNGWRYCDACNRPVEAAEHHCLPPAPLGWWEWRDRAEFAESLLCAVVFDMARAFEAIEVEAHGICSCEKQACWKCHGSAKFLLQMKYDFDEALK